VAKGRSYFWLKAEPDYKTKKYVTANEDDRLWSFLQKVSPGLDLAQIYFANGGELIEFNCKNLHRAIPREDTRVGIAMWQAAISLDNPNNWR
jgi:hypothetical protein